MRFKINEKLNIHKRLDNKTKKKLIHIFGLYEDVYGEYISHKHDFKHGITYVTIHVTEEWHDDKYQCVDHVKTYEFVDQDLVEMTKIIFVNK